MTVCIYVTLQQGQVQVLPRRLGHESGEGHERSITSAGLTNQTAAQERNGLRGILAPASDTLNTHPFFGLRKQCPGRVVSVHRPMGVHESILGGILVPLHCINEVFDTITVVGQTWHAHQSPWGREG